jgi:hypothetical protein
VKDAKSEAQKEIEDYRSQKESEFKSFETEVSCTAEHTCCCIGFHKLASTVEKDGVKIWTLDIY